jgi:glycyl-tRNA synthetase beta chain
MRGHQKYFALRDAHGKLAPHFLAIINMEKDAKGLVRAGHERVLRARFADARFFWESDQKCRLADNLEKLRVVTFQAKLGTYFEKVERVRAIAQYLVASFAVRDVAGADPAAVDRAALLAKCDLVTGMVGEFSELQGIMGGLYARAQGESPDVSEAVYDHYLPAGFGDSLPRNLTGCTVALADKLDTLAGCFAAGLAPTGSSDPFALRRAALGVVLIILDRGLRVSLKEIVAQTIKVLLEAKPNLPAVAQVENSLHEFLVERARYILQQRDGFAADEINASVAAGSEDMVDLVERIRAIREIRQSPDFGPLAVSFKRIRKILEKAGPSGKWQLPGVNEDLIEAGAERALHEAARRVGRQVGELKEDKRYQEALQLIAGLRPEVDQFFDKVMVMAEQEDVRRNRLTLLLGLLREFSTIADFSELAPSEKQG